MSHNKIYKKISVWLLAIIALFFFFFFTERDDHASFSFMELHFNERHIPFTEVTVNNNKYSASLDLGSKYTTLLEKTVPRSLYKATGRRVSVYGVDSEEHSEIYRLENLLIGNKVLTDVLFINSSLSDFPVYSVSDSGTSARDIETPSIVLGNDLFKDKVLLLDYREKRCCIGDDISVFRENGLLDDFFLKGELVRGSQHFLIRGIYEGVEKKWAIDTGSTSNFLLTTNADEGLKMSPMNTQEISWEGNPLSIGETYLLNRDLFGVVGGFLGAPFLENHQVVIDPKNSTCWIKPYE
jgi:hypothetical protein